MTWLKATFCIAEATVQYFFLNYFSEQGRVGASSSRAETVMQPFALGQWVG